MRVRRLGLLVAVLVSAASCQFTTAGLQGRTVTIAVEIDPALNKNFPLAVDFVVAYDEDLYREINDWDAEEWFQSRAQIQKDWGREALELKSREWVPGWSGSSVKLNIRTGAQGLVIFANYLTVGQHRLVVEDFEDFTLVLGERRGRVKRCWQKRLRAAGL